MNIAEKIKKVAQSIADQVDMAALISWAEEHSDDTYFQPPVTSLLGREVEIAGGKKVSALFIVLPEQVTYLIPNSDVYEALDKWTFFQRCKKSVPAFILVDPETWRTLSADKKVTIGENGLPVIEEKSAHDRWLEKIGDVATAQALRQKLYSVMRYKTVDDTWNTEPDEARPLASWQGKALTVDELTTEISRYIGDSQENVDALTLLKQTAKAYIREVAPDQEAE